MPNTLINLNELAEGALNERVQIELQRIAANIVDPNTKATALRTLKIEIKFKPTDDLREFALTELKVESKLAPAAPLGTKIILGGSGAKAEMAELVSGARNQMMIDRDGDLADDRGQKVPIEGQVSTVDDKKVVAFR